jgi:hypothetical protein
MTRQFLTANREITVLVCGGRDYLDKDRVFATLDEIDAGDKIGLLVHGGSSGADSLAGYWARMRDVPAAMFKPDWSEGPRAGPVRNARMLRVTRPDLVVAFPGGKGTADMVRLAHAAGVRTMEMP